jgi:hypothetical protein
MPRFTLMLAIAVLLALAVSANAQYTFQSVSFPDDTFTQLLGVNNHGVIAGYHNFTLNQGFTLILSENYTTENFPGSTQTQVIGVNNRGVTDGFYVDADGATHGFIDNDGTFITVDYPGTTFNQLLGINDAGQAAGYYMDSAGNFHPYIYAGLNSGEFTIVTTPGSSAQATGINNQELISGFYIDVDNLTHGFLTGPGMRFTTLDFPRDTSAMALGLNNEGRVVGTYTDQLGNVHGFIYDAANKSFEQVNDPKGVDSTIINGINDHEEIVGFYGPSNATIGFVGNPARKPL